MIVEPTIERGLVSLAVADLLAEGTGRPGGLVTAPVPDVGQAYRDLMPYWIVYPLPASFANTFGGIGIDVSFGYQVCSVGANYEQADWLADRVRATVLNVSANGLTVAGVSVWARLPDTGPQQPQKQADDLWQVDERFRINVSS